MLATTAPSATLLTAAQCGKRKDHRRRDTDREERADQFHFRRSFHRRFQIPTAATAQRYCWAKMSAGNTSTLAANKRFEDRQLATKNGRKTGEIDGNVSFGPHPARPLDRRRLTFWADGRHRPLAWLELRRRPPAVCPLFRVLSRLPRHDRLHHPLARDAARGVTRFAGRPLLGRSIVPRRLRRRAPAR